LGVGALDVTDSASLGKIDATQRQVSQTRGNLGAIEDRLQSGIRSLETARENTAAAGSRIRDVDFAKAAAEHTRGQLLEKVAIAVQAQANISSSLVLELLR